MLGFRIVCRILAEQSKSDVRNRCMENLHFMGHKVAPSCANCVSQFLRELYHDPLFGTFLFHSQVCRQGRSTTRCNNVECKALKFFQHLTELWWNYEIRIKTTGRITVGITDFCRQNKSCFLIPILIHILKKTIFKHSVETLQNQDYNLWWPQDKNYGWLQ